MNIFVFGLGFSASYLSEFLYTHTYEFLFISHSFDLIFFLSKTPSIFSFCLFYFVIGQHTCRVFL